MNIEWIKCTDRIPGDIPIIVRYKDEYPKIFDGNRITESLIRLCPNITNETLWTPYTEECWAFITSNDSHQIPSQTPTAHHPGSTQQDA